MKYIVGSFVVYLIATNRWQSYANLALVAAPEVAAKSGPEQSRDLIGGLATDALGAIKSKLLGAFGF